MTCHGTTTLRLYAPSVQSPWRFQIDSNARFFQGFTRTILRRTETKELFSSVQNDAWQSTLLKAGVDLQGFGFFVVYEGYQLLIFFCFIQDVLFVMLTCPAFETQP